MYHVLDLTSLRTRASGLAAKAWRRDTPEGTRPLIVPQWLRAM